MEGLDNPRSYTPPHHRPTSPPATPGAQSQTLFNLTASNQSPTYKRMGFAMFAHSPPFEHIQPTGDVHHFKYTRLRSNEPLTDPTISPEFQITSREPSRERAINIKRGVTILRVEEAAFILEEIGTESEYSSETEIVRPDVTDEESSEVGVEEQPEPTINERFQRLNCSDNSDSEQERIFRKLLRKKKRWSGLLKRSHSKSVGSDSDLDDAEGLDAHDVGSSARRLRRRVRGPGDRSSLIFEDLPDNHVLEVEEPDDGCHADGPPSLPSDTEEFSPRDFPFWVLKDPMEIDSSSSRPSSSHSSHSSEA